MIHVTASSTIPEPQHGQHDKQDPGQRGVQVEVLGRAATYAGHRAVASAAVQLAGLGYGAAFRDGCLHQHRQVQRVAGPRQVVADYEYLKAVVYVTDLGAWSFSRLSG